MFYLAKEVSAQTIDHFQLKKRCFTRIDENDYKNRPEAERAAKEYWRQGLSEVFIVLETTPAPPAEQGEIAYIWELKKSALDWTEI